MKSMRIPLASLAILVAATLGGCTTTATSTAPPVTRAAPVPLPGTSTSLPRVGLERVLGQNERGLIALFGKPDADVTEGAARKLQFASGICVLDAYLYPKGSGAPVVTHVDSRQPDGSPIDRASCVAALTRRGGGK
jgi:hypothetical protein